MFTYLKALFMGAEKKALAEILTVFNTAKAELEKFTSEAETEAKDLMAKATALMDDHAAATKALDGIKTIIG